MFTDNIINSLRLQDKARIEELNYLRIRGGYIKPSAVKNVNPSVVRPVDIKYSYQLPNIKIYNPFLESASVVYVRPFKNALSSKQYEVQNGQFIGMGDLNTFSSLTNFNNKTKIYKEVIPAEKVVEDMTMQNNIDNLGIISDRIAVENYQDLLY